jgi:DNA-binding beta-propeller fold protein YncE
LVTGTPRKARAGAAIAVAILFAVPALQLGSNLVNIAYGRSWPRSIVIDSGRQLAYVDGMSGIYPPEGFSFGVVYLGNESLGKVLGLPGTAGELALDESSGTVYAAGENSVTVIDGPNMSIERTITLKTTIFGMAFDGSTGSLLLTSGNSVFQMDPATGRLLRNATVGQSAEGIAVDSESGVVFVANYLSSSISVLRATDLTTVKTVQIPSPSYPSQLSLDSRRSILYASTDEQSVVEVSSTSYDVLGSIKVSQSSANGTYALVVDPARDRLFVATEPGTTVSELNATTHRVLSTFTVDSAAYEMAVDQTTGKLYVTNYHQITEISPTNVSQPGPQFPQYGLLAVFAVVSIAVAACLYAWRFRPSGGRRDGPSPLR